MSGDGARQQDEFLRIFGSDRQTAERRLREIGDKLTSYFRWRQLEDVDALVNEVLLRAMQRLATGTVLQNEDPMPFLYGIAKNVAFEARRGAVRQSKQTPIDDFADILATRPASADAHRFLEQALATLSPGDRSTLVAYCQADRDGRHALAGKLGKSPDALRVQICHIRRKLKQWRDDT